jgi:regulator of sirC expression with transglutaminase-like and TPR domain
VTAHEAGAELARLLEAVPRPFPLDRAALLLAVDAYPGLDVDGCSARIDDLAARVAALPQAEDPDPRRRLGALRRVLFEDEGFHGNRAAYYDLRNSYLNEVLERRLGIPITLSVLVLGVARRLDWPMDGVNFPGHFLVRYAAPEEPLAIDAFDGGLILGAEELRERWRLTTGTDAPASERMLEPADPRSVLVRILNNIRLIHAQDRSFRAAAEVTERMAWIEPHRIGHLVDACNLWLAAGEKERGLEHARAYLRAAGYPAGSEPAREILARLGLAGAG